jgi:hypothetical protein
LVTAEGAEGNLAEDAEEEEMLAKPQRAKVGSQKTEVGKSE